MVHRTIRIFFTYAIICQIEFKINKSIISVDLLNDVVHLKSEIKIYLSRTLSKATCLGLISNANFVTETKTKL